MGEDSISLNELRALCDEHERLLRAQSPEGSLPVDIEGELESMPPNNARLAVSRLALLKHAYRVSWERKALGSSSDAQDAARQLLRREPLSLHICGREVLVTGRSYAALYLIASHWLRIEELEKALIKEKSSSTHGRIVYEILLHRRAIWAHALTPDGAPAESISQAPEWWNEITPQDDSALLLGLFEVMHNRYGRMGPPPPQKKDSKKRESFGWHSLLMTLETRARVEPAAYYDRDLFQLVTRERVAAQSELEELLE